MINDGQPRTKSDKPMAETDIRLALEVFRSGIYRAFQVCFPACIYSYNRSTGKADVMPLVKQAYFNGSWNYIRRGIITGVTVRNIRCGGFSIEIPVYVGDTGWVISSDRDTQLIKQIGALTNSVLEKDRPIAVVEDDYQQQPNQLTLHDFSQGFFIPDNWGSFENWRYKDDPSAAVGAALYIGSSIDTEDKHQSGEAYEKKTTSSIVVKSDGGVSMASSSDKETDQNCHFRAEKNKVEAMAEDRKNNKSSSLLLDSEEGIVIRQDNEDDKQHFICSVKKGEFLLRMMDGDKSMSFSFADGKLNVSTSSDINVSVDGDTNFRCAGDVNMTSGKSLNVRADEDVNIMAYGDVGVAAQNVRVVAAESASVAAKVVSAAADETVNVNSGGTVNIGGAKKVNVNAGESVNFASGQKINVTSPDEINIVTASKTNIIAKKKGAEINIKTMSKESKIDIKMEGDSSQLGVKLEGKESKVEVATKEKNSPVSITTKGEGSNIAISAAGDKAKINIDASGDATVNSKKKVIVTGTVGVEISSPGTVSISGDPVAISGAVAISGSLTLNDKGFSPSEHPQGEATIKYWQHDR